MKKRLYIFLLSLFVLIPAYAQYVTGKVVADDDNQPLIGATVWFEENPKAKVRVNDNGLYKIRFRKGHLVFHCFGFKDKVVEVKKAGNIGVRLEPSSSQISEVTIEAKKKKYVRKGNPAVELMQKVMDARKTTDLYHNDFVTLDKYERMVLALNNITEEILEDDHFKKTKDIKEFVERSPETGALILPISMDEKATTELFRKNDNRKYSIIRGHNHESLLDLVQIGTSFEALFRDCITDVNIYQDHIHLFQHDFLSPIGGKEAIAFYHYAIEDSLFVGSTKCVKVSFTPSNVQDFGFSGNLYISADSTYRVMRATISVPVGTGVNFVKQMNVEQDFVTMPTGEQICSRNHMIFLLTVTSWIKQLYVDYNVRYSNWDFSPIPAKEFDSMSDSRYEFGAKHRDSEFWDENRPDTVSYAQSHIGDMKRKFTDRPAIRAMLYGAKVILDNWIETTTDPNKIGKFRIGPFFSSIGNSYMEGFRLRMGIRSTAALSKRWFFGGWAKYGFKDQRVKGNVYFTHCFIDREKDLYEFPLRNLTVSYTRDVHSPSDKFLQFDKDNAFMSLTWSGTHLQSYFENFLAEYEWEYENGLRYAITLKREWNEATGYRRFANNPSISGALPKHEQYADLMYVPVKPGLAPISRITMTDLNLFLEYQPGVKYVITGMKRLKINKEAPIYSIRHMVGVKGAGSDYTYNFTEFTVRKRFWLPQAWGNMDLRVQTGIQWNQVPYPLLIIPASNLSYIRSEGCFSLVKNMEFIYDRYASLMMYWDMNGKIFNRLPLIKHLKWREHLGVNLLWSALTPKNNPYLEQNQNSDILMYFPNVSDGNHVQYRPRIMDPSTPYVEAYIGIHNIWKFFSFDYVHRFTYNDTDPAQGINDSPKKWGFRFAFQASF